MKRVMILTMVMVILLGISDKALADVWSRCGLQSSHGFQHGGRRFLGGSFGRIVVGRGLATNVFRTDGIWNRCGLSSSYGGFGRYGYGRDKTLGRVLGYSELALGAFEVLDQSSTTNQLVNHQISVDNRMVSMAEREQEFKHQQIRAQNNTVLVKRGPIVLQVKKPKTQKNENQKVQQLQQQIKALEIQVKELQQQAKK